MLGWVKSIWSGWTAPQRTVRLVRGRYDAAQTTPENRRHWAYSDALSANSENLPLVRRTLRNRARYEVANNSWARGIVLTLAHDTIGTGPRLQMTTSLPLVNRAIESAFHKWARIIRLAEKLRTLRMARADSGEAFGILVNNPGLKSKVSLDLKVIEADQVMTPFGVPLDPGHVDGIVFDSYGNPIQYHVLKHHPGDYLTTGGLLYDYDPLPPSVVIHYYRMDRPGQARGIPDITPALPLFALLRRYTLAEITAAEVAAEIAMALETDSPANDEADELEPLDTINLERGMATTMPAGWKLSQVKAEHPNSTFDCVQKTLLNEIARCLNMPYNIAAGNSSGYNYASGRLDHQTYYKSIRVEQSHVETVILDHLLEAWLDEAVLIEGYLPQAARAADFEPSHQWFWDGHEHVDPAKEASAQQTRLLSGTTNLAIEYARQGRDWEAELNQRAKEVALERQLGLSFSVAAPGALAAPGATVPNVQPQETEDEEPIPQDDA